MESVSVALLELTRLLLRLLTLTFCIHVIGWLRSAWRPLPTRTEEQTDGAAEIALPSVVVQLPLRNEIDVAERVITAAAALDYPGDRLDIQVLDDSSDETVTVSQDRARQLAADGCPIRWLGRSEPVGDKAGALNAGLAQSDAELVAVFDADNIPPQDFLRRHVEAFRDPQLGFLLVRWGYTNRQLNPLTRLQALILDAVVGVGQHARSLSGLAVTFNGTAGILRRRCLDEAGGWPEGLVTEDQALSFTAHLRGWRGEQRRESVVPTELPERMASFQIQQQRWAFGSGPTLRQLLVPVLRAPVAGRLRAAMLSHPGRHLAFPIIFVSCVLVPLATFSRVPYCVDYGVPVNLALLLMLLMGLLSYYGVGARLATGRWRGALLAPLIIPLSSGMSLAMNVSVVRGLASTRGRFVRTPKLGSGGDASRDVPAGPGYAPSAGLLPVVKCLVGVAHGYQAFLAFSHGVLVYGAFLLTVALAFLWVGGASLIKSRPRPAARARG